jgi:predicted enzyme related to lactoylglutathione lyase
MVAGPNGMGSYGRYCVIRDPAGAHLALFEPARG